MRVRITMTASLALSMLTAAAYTPTNFKDASKIKSWDAWNDHEKQAAITNILQKEKRSVTWEKFNKVDPGLKEIGRITPRISARAREFPAQRWLVRDSA